MEKINLTGHHLLDPNVAIVKLEGKVTMAQAIGNINGCYKQLIVDYIKYLPINAPNGTVLMNKSLLSLNLTDEGNDIYENYVCTSDLIISDRITNSDLDRLASTVSKLSIKNNSCKYPLLWYDYSWYLSNSSIKENIDKNVNKLLESKPKTIKIICNGFIPYATNSLDIVTQNILNNCDGKYIVYSIESNNYGTMIILLDANELLKVFIHKQLDNHPEVTMKLSDSLKNVEYYFEDKPKLNIQSILEDILTTSSAFML